MTAGTAWLNAFPLPEAESAVEALVRGWNAMAAIQRRAFHPKIPEPKLTRVVRWCIRTLIAPEMKMLGYWGTEGVENDVDPDSAEILGEGRTDIAYHWNNTTTQLSLVFEFKKLTATKGSREQYLDAGLVKFVTGLYSEGQAAAVMVGILGADRAEVVAGLRGALCNRATNGRLNLCADAAKRLVLDPSLLFPKHADFDTEHLRSKAKAPAHGTIRLAHLFVAFPYMTYPPKGSRRAAVMARLEGDDD